MTPDIEGKRVLVLGVGNMLLGDDGFGPAVAQSLLREGDLPSDVLVADVGTSVREVLFDLLLADRRPQRIVVVDAVDLPGHVPGQVLTLETGQLPEARRSDFSLHQFPAVCLLAELEHVAGVDVRVVAAQVGSPPEFVGSELSAPLSAAVEVAGKLVRRLIAEESS